MPKKKYYCAKRVFDIAVTKKDLESLALNKNDYKLLIEDITVFDRLERAKGGDWLEENEEKPQSIKSFNRKSMKAIPHGTYNTIYVQPMGDHHPDTPSYAVIAEFLRAFFLPLKVEFLPTKKNMEKDWTHNNDWGVTQYFTGDILDWQISQDVRRKRKTLRSELVIVALTADDLYSEGFGFVFGLAKPSDANGVFSLARLNPAYPDLEGRLSDDDDKKLFLRRAVKVLCHEIGHLFGLTHCVYYHCLMNGSNHLEEMDSRPSYLCPICVMKLKISLKFSLVERYEALNKVFNKHMGISWYQERLTLLSADPASDEKVNE